MIKEKHKVVINVLLERLENDQYMDIMRNDEGHFDVFQKMKWSIVERGADTFNYIREKVIELVEEFSLTKEDIKIIEEYLNNSSLFITESTLFDYKFPKALAVIVVALYSISLVAIEFFSHEFVGMFWVVKFFMPIMLACFIWLATQRNAALKKYSNRKKILAEHFKSLL